MILLYRITPFLVAMVSALGFAAFLLRWMHPFIAVFVTVLLLLLLLARLLRFQLDTFSFWFFLGTAGIFLLSAFSVLFLFESMTTSLVVACVTIGLLTLFSEFIFLYTHIPSAYQPFSLEYLTLILNLLSIFFLTCFGFAIRLLVQIPLSFLSVSFFLLSFFLIYGMLWVSKSESVHTRFYAGFGAILFTELFIAISFLPTGFYTNAAFLTVFSYVFFGLTRAQVIHKLTKEVARRYLITAGVLLLFIGVSSQWL